MRPPLPPLSEPFFQSSDSARELLELLRWRGEPVCPQCGAKATATRLRPRPSSKAPVRDGVWRCGSCRSQFTVTVGTLLEGSRLDLYKWLLLARLLCEKPSRVRPSEVQKLLSVSYKTAWLLVNRLRWVKLPKGVPFEAFVTRLLAIAPPRWEDLLEMRLAMLEKEIAKQGKGTHLRPG